MGRNKSSELAEYDDLSSALPASWLEPFCDYINLHVPTPEARHAIGELLEDPPVSEVARAWFKLAWATEEFIKKEELFDTDDEFRTAAFRQMIIWLLG